MPIKITCPGCKRVLTVKDEMAGKQGKCPACQKAIMVPGPTPAGVQKTGGQRPPKVEEVEEIVEVVEVEEFDDEPPRKKGPAGKRSRDQEEFEYVEEDEPRPKKKGQRSSDDDDDEPRRKPARRRDEDDEDDEPRRRPAARRGRDDDDEDDDRPRRRRSRDDDDEDDRPRRRSRDDDDDDRPRRRSRDDDDDRRPKKSSRATWDSTGTGLLLVMIGAFLQAGAFCLLALSSLLVTLGAAMGVAFFWRVAGTFSWPVAGLFLASWIVPVVGYAFTVTAPGKYGARGLGIATLAVGGTAVLLLILLFVQGYPVQWVSHLANGSMFGGHGGMPGGIPIDLGGLLASPFYRTGPSEGLLYFWALCELARLCLCGLFVQAVGKNFRDSSLASSGMVVAIVAPSSFFVVNLLRYLLAELLKNSTSRGVFYLGAIVELVFLLGIAGVLGWYALTMKSGKEAIQYAK